MCPGDGQVYLQSPRLWTCRPAVLGVTYSGAARIVGEAVKKAAPKKEKGREGRNVPPPILLFVYPLDLALGGFRKEDLGKVPALQ